MPPLKTYRTTAIYKEVGKIKQRGPFRMKNNHGSVKKISILGLEPRRPGPKPEPLPLGYRGRTGGLVLAVVQKNRRSFKCEPVGGHAGCVEEVSRLYPSGNGMEHVGLPSRSISLDNEKQLDGALGSSERELHTPGHRRCQRRRRPRIYRRCASLNDFKPQ